MNALPYGGSGGVYRNLVKARLANNEMVLTLRILQARSVDILKIAKSAGFHSVLLDLQHSAMSLDTCCQMASAALDAGLTPIVRVPAGMLTYAAVALDGGAQVLLLPGIETAEAAAEAVRTLRYPPVGERSVTSALPQTGFNKMPAAQLIRAVDAETSIQVLVESQKAVDNAAGIAAVDGIDALVTGTNDLCASLGLFGEHGHPTIREIHRKLAAICQDNGIRLIPGGIGNLSILEDYVAMGAAPSFLAGTDTDFLIEGCMKAVANFQTFGQHEPADEQA